MWAGMKGYTTDINKIMQQMAAYSGPETPRLINIESLKVRIFGDWIVNLLETPHYQYVLGDKKPYMEYLYRYNHLIKESLESFEYVIHGELDYLEGKHCNDFIRCDENYVIVDGIHRATRLYQLGIKHIPILIVK